LMNLDLTETISVNETTGAKKGVKKARFSLIPPEALWALAEHFGVGALKYGDRNWEKGYEWAKTLDALERHLNQMKMGEWRDPETGSAHIIAVAWHAMVLFTYKVRGVGFNDIHEGLNK
jgi:hypothetical protein